MYNVKAVPKHDFVCDNNNVAYKHGSNVVNDWDWDCFWNLKSLYDNTNSGNDCDCVNNNANSIQAINATLLKVKINGIFSIFAKKKYILYLLIL